MKSELVKETRKMCRDLYDELKVKYEELKSEGADEKTIKSIIVDAKESINFYNKINTSNVDELRSQVVDFCTTCEFRYGINSDSMNFPDLDENEKEINVPNVEEEDKSNKRGIGWTLAGIAALAGVAGYAGYRLANNNNSNIETVEETEQPTKPSDILPEAVAPVIIDENTNEPVVTEQLVESQAPVVESQQLRLGEYGTFLDVKNDEQVNARAQYIIDTYYSQFMNKLSDQEKSLITRENIANVIRVMAGELAVDENGNKYMDGNIVDNYGQMFTSLVGDIPSSPQLDGYRYNIPTYLFSTDGSKLSQFLMNYDASYQKITNGYNQASNQRILGEGVNGGTVVREGISELGHRFWNEWVMQGIFGDVNPYNFDAKDRLFAYLGSFAKYGTYAFEYNLDARQAVCIPVCVNYDTKEINELPVNEIFVGYASGEWNNVIAKAAGIEANAEPDSVYFTQDLMDELTWKYNNLHQMSLSK